MLFPSMPGKARLPYLIVSAVAHAALLAAVFYAGPYSIKAATLDRHARNAEEADIRRRVEEIGKIKSLLAKSRQETASANTAGAGGAKPASPATPRQMLEQARQLSAEIERMERRTQVRELALLLKVPEEQAMRLLPAPARKPHIPAPRKAIGTRQALAELREHQQLARAALLKREQQLQRELGGTRVRPKNARADLRGGGVPTDLAGMGDGGTGKAGQGGKGGKGGTGGAGKGGLPGEDVPNAAHIEIRGYIEQAGMNQGGVPRGGAWDLSTPRHQLGRGYGAAVALPAVDAGAAHKISAHAIGKGAPYADRIYLNRWHIIGPFPGRGPRSSIDLAYPPEMMVDLDARYAGVKGSTLAWEYRTSPGYPTVPAVRAQDAIYYAYTEVVVDEDVDLVLAIGSDDDTKLWLNDRLVWLSGDAYKPWYRSPGYVGMPQEIADWNLSEGTRKLRFRKGRNSVLLKLYNGASLAFFSVVILGEGQRH
ncbi:MAG: hypothetical protein JWQ80_2140 [Massilia sp.]|nr:hypothetical protein [Massilia sp.]